MMIRGKKQDSFDLSKLQTSLPSNIPGLSAKNRDALIDSLKNQIQCLSGRNSNVLETLSPDIKRRVEFLKDLQRQHDEIESKFKEELAAIKAKYQKFYDSHYKERFEIVSGVANVDSNTPGEKVDEEKGVPDFWLKAMKANDLLSEEIQEHDEGALKYLRDIRWSTLEKSKSFRVDFFFDSNPYFKNTVLTKTYQMANEDEPILHDAFGTEIEWYPRKCLTQVTVKKMPKKGSKIRKPVTKIEKLRSFFNFFVPSLLPDDDVDIDENTAKVLMDQMEKEYHIGTMIRDKIIPHAVSWFTGEAVQNDDESDDDDAVHEIKEAKA